MKRRKGVNQSINIRNLFEECNLDLKVSGANRARPNRSSEEKFQLLEQSGPLSPKFTGKYKSLNPGESAK